MTRPPWLLLIAATLLGAVPSAAQPCREARSGSPRDQARAEAERRFSDSLQAEVIGALRQAGHPEPRGLVVVDLRNRRTGQAEVHTFTTPEVGEAVRVLLADRAARVAAWPGRESTFHLRLDPPSPTAPGARECEPRLRDRDGLSREAARILQQVRGVASPGSSRQIVHLRMLVDREGEVVFAELTRRSMQPETDRLLLELGRRQRFVPATLDGVPVDVWVQLPFHVEYRR